MACFENVRALEGNRGKFGGWCQVAENKTKDKDTLMSGPFSFILSAVGGAGERDWLLLVD